MYVAGLILLAVVFLIVQSFGSEQTDPSDDTPRDYQWGDEFYEYSYRHPWEDDA